MICKKRSTVLIFLTAFILPSIPALSAQSHKHTEAESAHDSKNATMKAAKDVLDDATFLEQKATSFIQHSNSIRKQIKSLRAEERSIEDPDIRAAHKNTVDALAQQIEHWQNSSAELRDLSDSLKLTSMSLFIEGFSLKWSEWINNPLPLSADKSANAHSSAHNNQIRSAHPSMQALTPETSEMPEKHEGMSMQVPELLSQPPTDNLNVSSFQISRDQNYLAHIEVETADDNASSPTSVPLNEIHQWRLLVSDLYGQPIRNATIDIVGHMPGHVHGLPTQPKITEEIAPGVYRVNGVKFQMQGWWIIEFNIEVSDIADTIKFDLLL